MSNVGMNGSGDSGRILNNPAKYLGTGPTETEKKIAKEVVENVKEAVSTIKDSTSNFIKTPEGKAITTGVLLKTVMPFALIGDVFILGGAAACAKKFLSNEDAPKKAEPSTGGAAAKAVEAGAKAAAVAAGVMVGGVAGAVAGGAIMASEAAKAVGQAAAQQSGTGNAQQSGTGQAQQSGGGQAKEIEKK